MLVNFRVKSNSNCISLRVFTLCLCLATKLNSTFHSVLVAEQSDHHATFFRLELLLLLRLQCSTVRVVSAESAFSPAKLTLVLL